MAKAGDEGAENKSNGGARAKTKTRAVALTRASDAMAKTNEDKVAEATKNDSAEVSGEAIAKTNSARSNSRRTPLRLPLLSIQSKPSPPKRAIIRDGRWRPTLLSLQNCSALSHSTA